MKSDSCDTGIIQAVLQTSFLILPQCRTVSLLQLMSTGILLFWRKICFLVIWITKWPTEVIIHVVCNSDWYTNRICTDRCQIDISALWPWVMGDVELHLWRNPFFLVFWKTEFWMFTWNINSW
jgi:hypothetical protein